MAVIKHIQQRVAVFIDTQNLYHSARNLYQSRVNFAAIIKEAVAGRQLIRATAYVITTESGDEKNFFEALEKMGIETKTKDLQIFFGGAKKADWDVGLAVDAIRFAGKVDAIVIISGDGDFIPLVEYLKHMGTQVEGISFGKSTSSKLRETLDDFIDLCEEPAKYLINPPKTKGSAQQQKSTVKTTAPAPFVPSEVKKAPTPSQQPTQNPAQHQNQTQRRPATVPISRRPTLQKNISNRTARITDERAAAALAKQRAAAENSSTQ